MAVSSTSVSVRLWAHVGVLGARPGRWHDFDAADPEVTACLRSGLLAEHSPQGEGPPAGPLPRPCGCGH